jgi:hypothetical protein
VNLIPYNPNGMYDGSSRASIAAFRMELDRAGVPATVRLTRGRDIEAVCGQLAAAPKARARRAPSPALAAPSASASAVKIRRMLRLGILVVVLVVATVVMVVIRNEVVRPALRRRRLAQLEEENRRLDELLKARDNEEAHR